MVVPPNKLVKFNYKMENPLDNQTCMAGKSLIHACWQTWLVSSLRNCLVLQSILNLEQTSVAFLFGGCWGRQKIIEQPLSKKETSEAPFVHTCYTQYEKNSSNAQDERTSQFSNFPIVSKKHTRGGPPVMFVIVGLQSPLTIVIIVVSLYPP